MVSSESSTEQSFQDVGADLIPMIIWCIFRESPEPNETCSPIAIPHPEHIIVKATFWVLENGLTMLADNARPRIWTLASVHTPPVGKSSVCHQTCITNGLCPGPSIILTVLLHHCIQGCSRNNLALETLNLITYELHQRPRDGTNTIMVDKSFRVL